MPAVYEGCCPLDHVIRLYCDANPSLCLNLSVRTRVHLQTYVISCCTQRSVYISILEEQGISIAVVGAERIYHCVAVM
jgi:hypothetical protein